MVPFILILKGISGIFIQSIILREVFSNFFGNELSFNLVISFWLLGGAIGSYISRNLKNYQKIYIAFTISEIIFLILSLIFLRIFSNIQNIFYISNLRFFTFSFLISALGGFFEGARIILLSFLYQKEKSSGKIYGFEGTGFLIGGFLFYLFLIFELDIFFLIFISSIINFSTIFYFKKTKPLFSPFLFLLFILPFSKNIDLKTNSIKYKGYQLIESKETVYNKFVILKKENQYILITNGFQEFSSQPDYFSIKNISFFSLSFCNKIENVGVYGNYEIIDEIEKYRIGKIYYFEIDRTKLKIIKNYFMKNGYKNIIFVNEDVSKFIHKSRINFDTFIITNSLPMNLKENYILTDGFFKKISNCVKNFVIVLPGSYDYIGKQLAQIHSSIYKTGKKYFKNDIIVFTYPMIFIFSNEKLDLNKKIIIDREFFNEKYLNYTLDENKRNSYIKKILGYPVEENNVSNQFCLYSAISYYFSQTSQRTGEIINNLFLKISKIKKFTHVIFSILFLILLFFPADKSIIFINGFSSLSFETVFIFLFQISYGFLYGFISKIIGIFMAGISFGSLLSTIKNHTRKILIYSEIFHFIFYLFGYFFLMNNKFPLILIFISGFLTGWEFGIISFLSNKENIVDVTGKLYSIDLTGAIISSVFLPCVFIPGIGMYYTLLLIPVLKFSNLLNLLGK
jgi:predicted membrane-bound spermidine synthase